MSANGLTGIVIDMQPYFLDYFEFDVKEMIIEEQLKVINELKKVKSPVFILEYFGNGKTDYRIREAVKPFDLFNRITRFHNDGFSISYLNPILKLLKTKEIVCMGINASACVQETIKSAIKKGYKVTTSMAIIGDHISYKTEELEEEHEKMRKLLKEKTNDFSEIEVVSKNLTNPNILEWYKENTRFFDNSDELLRYIKANK